MAREANHVPMIRAAVENAGGVDRVAGVCQCTSRTVYNWMRNGFPYTDLTGKTQYAKTLARLAGVSADALLKAKPDKSVALAQ